MGSRRRLIQSLIALIALAATSFSTVVAPAGSPKDPLEGTGPNYVFAGIAPPTVAPPTAPATHVNLLDNDGEQFTVDPCRYQDPAGYRVRPSLGVGVTDYGTLTLPTAAGGVGIRVPNNLAFESFANGWWGQGWIIGRAPAFGPTDEWFYYVSGATSPTNALVGTIERVDDYYVDSSRYIDYPVTLFLRSRESNGSGVDQGVLLEREFVIDKWTCDVTLYVTVTNQFLDTSGAGVPDNFYVKEIDDWDTVFPSCGTFFNNWWTTLTTSVPFGNPGLDGAAARCTVLGPNDPGYECATYSAALDPDVVDLDAWDDTGLVFNEGGSVVSPPPGFGTPPFNPWDWNLGMRWERPLEFSDELNLVITRGCAQIPAGGPTTPVYP